jgi:hypothetical protein
VSDDQHRHLVAQRRDQLFDLRRRDGIQRRGRLVEQQDLRRRRQRARDAQALHLAAGERQCRVRQAILDLVPQRGAAQRLLHFLGKSGAVAYATQAQAVGDVLENRFGKRVRLLEHHADAHAHFDRIHARTDQVQIVRMQRDAAFIARIRLQIVHAVEAAQERALAASPRDRSAP